MYNANLVYLKARANVYNALDTNQTDYTSTPEKFDHYYRDIVAVSSFAQVDDKGKPFLYKPEGVDQPKTQFFYPFTSRDQKRDGTESGTARSCTQESCTVEKNVDLVPVKGKGFKSNAFSRMSQKEALHHAQG